MEGVPFSFVTDDSERSAAVPILVPPGVPVPDLVGVVPVPEGALEVPGAGGSFLAGPRVRRVADRPLRALGRYYFISPRMRRLLDRAGVTARFLESALFGIPRERAALVRLVGPLGPPSARSATPVLVERWRRADGSWLLHLVNYAETPAVIEVTGPGGPLTASYSPDAGTEARETQEGLTVRLETYVVLEWRSRNTRGD
jgi:hypothetical protein